MVVLATGTGWIERPDAAGGDRRGGCRDRLNLAAVPVKNMAPTPFDAWMQALTFVSVGAVAAFARGMTQRLLILVGLIVAS